MIQFRQDTGVMMKNVRHMVMLALLISQALVLSFLESWIPVPVAIPGVKLGLANIISIVAISFWGYVDALIIVTLRCALSSMVGGGMTGFVFSLAGGILSATIMTVLYKRFSKYFSILGVSIAGSIMHNVGQLAAAALIMKELSVFSYLPVLLVSGIIMGCFVGFCSNFLIKALYKTNVFF